MKIRKRLAKNQQLLENQQKTGKKPIFPKSVQTFSYCFHTFGKAEGVGSLKGLQIDPLDQPTFMAGIELIVFAHVVRSHFSKYSKTKQK